MFQESNSAINDLTTKAYFNRIFDREKKLKVCQIAEPKHALLNYRVRECELPCQVSVKLAVEPRSELLDQKPEPVERIYSRLLNTWTTKLPV